MIFGKYINCYYRRYWYYFFIGILALVLVDIVQLFIPEIIGNAISSLDKGTFVDKDYITVLLSLVGIGALMFIGRSAWRLCINGVGQKIEYDLRERMFIHAEKLSVEYYKKQKRNCKSRGPCRGRRFKAVYKKNVCRRIYQKNQPRVLYTYFRTCIK